MNEFVKEQILRKKELKDSMDYHICIDGIARKLTIHSTESIIDLSKDIYGDVEFYLTQRITQNIIDDLENIILNNEDDFDRGKGKFIIKDYIKFLEKII